MHLIWPHVREMLQAVAAGGLSEFSAIEDDVLGGRSLLWIAWADDAIQAALVTELVWRDGVKECCIALCGGHGMAEWLGAYPEIERHAREEGCSVMRIIGRPGWERILPGYRRRAVVLTKDLTDG